MKHLQHFLEKILKKRGMYTEAKASYVIEKMKNILSDHLGDEVLEQISVQKFSEKKLTIICENSSWKHLLSQHNKSFLSLLQAEFSEKEVEKIIVK